MSLTTLNTSSADKLVLEAFNVGAKAYEPQGQKIFTHKEAEREDEKALVMSVDGSFTEVAQASAYPSADAVEAGTKTLTQMSFKKKIPVSMLMQAFDNYGAVMEVAENLGYLARHKLDTLQADILNNASGTTTTWDGYALKYASHKIGTSTQTQSNTISGALTEPTLNEAYYELDQQKGHDTLVGTAVPKGSKRFLVVPPQLAMTGYKLINSVTGPETANRESGYLNTLGIELLVWPLLTSATSWGLVSEPRWNRLRLYYKIPPKVTFVDGSKTTNGSLEYRIDFTAKAGAIDYLGIEWY